MKDLIERTYAHLPADDRADISLSVLLSPVRSERILEAFSANAPITKESAERILKDLRVQVYGAGHRLAA